MLSAFYALRHGSEVVNLRYCGLHEKPLEELGFGLLARQLPAVDAARANLLAATRPGLRNEVFNIAPDSPLTQDDSNAVCRGPTPTVRIGPDPTAPSARTSTSNSTRSVSNYITWGGVC